MRKLLIAALLFAGCKKEPAPVKKDEIRFEAKSEDGGVMILKDGKEIINKSFRGVWSESIPAAPGRYEINFVSVPPGFSYTYVYHNDTLKAAKEHSHSRRTMWTIYYEHK